MLRQCSQDSLKPDFREILLLFNMIPLQIKGSKPPFFAEGVQQDALLTCEAVGYV